jgi:hypothetical protein
LAKEQEHFPAKWTPVRRRKCDHTNKGAFHADFYGFLRGGRPRLRPACRPGGGAGDQANPAHRSAHRGLHRGAEGHGGGVRAHAGGAGKPDPKILAELESLAKKHGFTSFSEFDAAGANISMIMSGLDPKSKAFSEPSVVIRREIEEVKADKAIFAAEKAQMLKELDDALKTAQPVQFPANIELVKKYFDKLVAVLQESHG